MRAGDRDQNALTYLCRGRILHRHREARCRPRSQRRHIGDNLPIAYSLCKTLDASSERSASTGWLESVGSLATICIASFRAAWMRRGFFSASIPRSETPHWLLPYKSPAPRASKSASARKNPSSDLSRARRRFVEISLLDSDKRKHNGGLDERITRPRS